MEIAHWDELVVANPDGGDTLQSAAFARSKAKFGWTPHYIIHELTDADVATLYMSRKVTGLGELWYAPKGPGVTTINQLQEVTKQLKEKSRGVFAAKIEPDLLTVNVRRADLESLGLRKVRDIQYNWATVIVDLKPTEEEVIASFKQKTRYNIRLAERKEVKVEAVEATDANLAKMYELMQITAERAGVFLRSRDYFYTFWRNHAEAGCGQIFFASFEGQVLAGAFISYLGSKGLYKDGGSAREHTELQAPYALQWEIMRWLKQHGVESYDLHGTPPADRIEDKTHPLHGLARFKTGFNENVTEFVGTYDLPLTSKYDLWTKAGERLATAYHHRLKKELFY